jgi:hypothetical protein
VFHVPATWPSDHRSRVTRENRALTHHSDLSLTSFLIGAFLRPKTPRHLGAIVRPTHHRMACALYMRTNDGRYMVQTPTGRTTVATIVDALTLAQGAGLILRRAC